MPRQVGSGGGAIRHSRVAEEPPNTLTATDKPFLKQSGRVSQPLHFQLGWFLVWGLSVQCIVLSRVPGLHPLVTNSTSCPRFQLWQPKIFPNIAWEHSCPWVRTTALKQARCFSGSRAQPLVTFGRVPALEVLPRLRACRGFSLESAHMFYFAPWYVPVLNTKISYYV